MIELVVDMGTANTKIFKSGSGVVLVEPSVVLLKRKGTKRQFIAAGKDVEKADVLPSGSEIVCPIDKGFITDIEMAGEMLACFINRFTPKSIIPPRIKIRFLTPVGATKEDKIKFEKAAHCVNLEEVEFISWPELMTKGLGREEFTTLIADLGAGKTDIVIVKDGELLTGATFDIGGNDMDLSIKEYVEYRYGVEISEKSARNAKITAGSLYKNDSASIEVTGRALINNNETSLNLTAVELSKVLYEYYYKFFEMIDNILTLVPAEIVKEVKDEGVFFSGGASLMPGLSKLANEIMRISINMVDEPLLEAFKGL